MMTGFFRRATWRGLSLGLVCAGLCAILPSLGIVRGLEGWILDSYFSVRDSRDTNTRVVVVAVDDETFRQVKKPFICYSPEFARAVRYIDAQGASSIGIDILASDDYSFEPWIALPPEITGQSLSGYAAPFGEVIKESGKVVLPRLRRTDENGEPAWNIPLMQWRGYAINKPQPDPTDIAFVDLTEDRDIFVRRQQLALIDDETVTNEAGEDETASVLRVQFALAILAKARNENVHWDGDTQQLMIGEEPIPLDDEKKLRINYVGPPGTFEVIPFHEILAAEKENRPIPQLRDAMVIVGTNAPDLQDFHATPYSNLYARETADGHGGKMNGSEIQANIIATINDRAYFEKVGWPRYAMLALLGMILGPAVMRVGLSRMFAVAVVNVLLWYVVGYLAFVKAGLQFDVIGFMVLGVMVCTVGALRRAVILQRILRAVKSAPIARAFESDPRRLGLGGELREVSILFADVRGFTTFSEGHRDQPERVVALLNAYFTAIVPEIERHGGTLNQYMGDGIMVIYGAPEPDPKHVFRAVKGAIGIARVVRDHPELWERHGNPGMRIGVGVHTGPALIGAIGSPDRLDYTAIGDTTNTAARIEAKTKDFGVDVLISQETLERLTTEERTELGLIEVEPFVVSLKGKAEPLRVFPVPVADSAKKNESK